MQDYVSIMSLPLYFVLRMSRCALVFLVYNKWSLECFCDLPQSASISPKTLHFLFLWTPWGCFLIIRVIIITWGMKYQSSMTAVKLTIYNYKSLANECTQVIKQQFH